MNKISGILLEIAKSAYKNYRRLVCCRYDCEYQDLFLIVSAKSARKRSIRINNNRSTLIREVQHKEIFCPFYQLRINHLDLKMKKFEDELIGGVHANLSAVGMRSKVLALKVTY